MDVNENSPSSKYWNQNKRTYLCFYNLQWVHEATRNVWFDSVE